MPVNSNAQPLLIPQDGERAFVAGQTGSGKTAFSLFLLKRIKRSPIIIYDTKEEPKFLTLPFHSIANSLKDVSDQVQNGESDYIIFRPAIEMLSRPEALDGLLLHHYHKFGGVPAYLDETYSFHDSGRAGPGLVALLTRGRSRGISLIMATQRPKWISVFTMSEANRFYLFKLAWKDDRKTLAGIIPEFDKLKHPPKFGFHFFQQGDEQPRLYGPVKLEPGQDQGYTDVSASNASEAHSKTLWV